MRGDALPDEYAKERLDFVESHIHSAHPRKTASGTP